jgi:glutathione-regulated potassium-efflux system ancillary protein KefC
MELHHTAIFLTAAVVAVPLCKRLGLGSVLGYLFAGAMIGPSGMGLISEVEQTLHIAEFGVVLLLFLVGLELQPKRLWAMRRAVFGLGGVQVVGTAVLLTAAGIGLGLSFEAALVTGCALSFSSTAFVLQILSEKSELVTPHGRASFSILLFQDLAAIPVLAIIPLLGTVRATGEATHPATQAALVVGVLVVVVVVGRFLLRPVFRVVASTHSHELSTATALLVVVGTALAMSFVGLSMELGAFLAGVLLADSEYRHELEANIEPFKGLLLGLFFMAVGMSANFATVVERPGAVAALVIGLVVVKIAVLSLLARLSRMRGLAGVSLAIALSQGGEFAFVIFAAAAAVELLTPATLELLVVVVTGSMIVTPLLFIARDRWLQSEAQDGRPFDSLEGAQGRVVIAGFGRYGQIVARILRMLRIPFTALDHSTVQVDFVRKFGNQIYYGDASRIDLLRAARVGEAAAFVLALDDVESSIKTARTVREHFPHVKVFARARNRQHAHALRELGVQAIERETLLSSLSTARGLLEELGLDAGEAREAVERFREIDERALWQQFEVRDDEQALIASAKQTAEDLERIFDNDARARR